MFLLSACDASSKQASAPLVWPLWHCAWKTVENFQETATAGVHRPAASSLVIVFFFLLLFASEKVDVLKCTLALALTTNGTAFLGRNMNEREKETEMEVFHEAKCWDPLLFFFFWIPASSLLWTMGPVLQSVYLTHAPKHLPPHRTTSPHFLPHSLSLLTSPRSLSGFPAPPQPPSRQPIGSHLATTW